MSDKKTFVLDTSVLIHDPSAFFNFEEHNVVIPYIVIHEIDGLRKAPNGRGYAAREFIKKIDQFNKTSTDLTNVPLGENKGFLSISLLGMPQDIDFSSEIQKSLRDDVIINCASELNKNTDTIFVSKDIGQRIKASIKGISVQDYLNSKIKNFEKRYTGLHKEEVILDSPTNGDPYSTVFESPDYLLHNEFCNVKFKDYENVPGILYRNQQGTLVPVPDYKKGIFGIKPLDNNQKMVMDLLLDPKIPLVAISGTHGSGKAQPLDAKVLTPDGYKEMKDINLGDYVIDGTGKKSKVIGVFPQEEQPIYKVDFSDNTSTECSLDHLWNVKTIESNKWETLSLKDILKKDYNKYLIPTSKTYDIDKNKTLYADVYEIGRLIKKEIPEKYKFTSIENRINLLQGILDSNGNYKKGSLYVKTEYNDLKNDIIFIVNSIGGTCKSRSKGNNFIINIYLPEDISPFRTQEKLDKYDKTRVPERFIRNIQFCGKKNCQCILIESEIHTYMTNDFIITHNTLLSLAAAVKQYEDGDIESIMYVKPIIPVGGRDLGYLPGDKEEKLHSWAKPLFDNLKVIEMSKGQKYGKDMFCEDINLELEAYTYMRGRTFHNTFVILDECLVGDNIVWMSDGRAIPIESVKDKDNVISYDIDRNIINNNEVNNKFSKLTKDILHIYTSRGTIDCTPTHQLYVYENGRTLLKKQAKDITKNDLIPFVNKLPHIVKNDMSKEQGSLYAYNYVYKNNDNVPEIIWNSPIDTVKSFIFTCFDNISNVEITKDDIYINFKTYNKVLAYQMQAMLAKFNILSSVSSILIEEKYYILQISDYFANLFFKEIGVLKTDEQIPDRQYNENYIYPVKAYFDSGLELNDYSLPFIDNTLYNKIIGELEEDYPTCCEILEIEKEVIFDGIETYDFTVDNDHTFIVNGIISSNCQNVTPLEIRTALSRIGENTKCVLLADLTQIDNPYTDAESCGFSSAVEALKDHPLFAAAPLVHSQRSEISELVAKRMNPS